MSRLDTRSKAPIELVPISRINVGWRRRQKLGLIQALAKNIEQIGLLHPIVIDDDNLLVIGERRLKACERLGWKSIPARRFRDLSPEKLREMELDENVFREPLSAPDASRERIRVWEAARHEAELEAAAKAGEDEKMGDFPIKKPAPRGKGRPKGSTKGKKTKGTEQDLEKRTGIDRRTARDAKKHLDAIDTYPFLNSGAWSQDVAFGVAKQLDSMRPKVREATVAIVSEPAVPVSTAKAIVENVAAMPKGEQDEIAQLYYSEESVEHDLAMTKAAKVPPMPDPRLAMLREAIRFLGRAQKKLTDSHTAKIGRAKKLTEQILGEMEKERHGR